MSRPSTKFLIPNTLLLVLINKLSLTESGSQRHLRRKWINWRGQQNECSKTDLQPVRVNFHWLHYATVDFLGRQVLIRDILWVCLWKIVLINLIDVCRPSSLWAATFLNVVLSYIRLEKSEKWSWTQASEFSGIPFSLVLTFYDMTSYLKFLSWLLHYNLEL